MDNPVTPIYPDVDGTKTRANSPVVTLAPDSWPLQVGTGRGKGSVELTRPANTTAYAINGVISDSTSAPTLLVIPGLARVVGGNGFIVKVRAFTDLKTSTAQLRLHIYSEAITPINDGTLFPLLYANKAKKVGYIDLPAMAAEDATASTAASALWTGQLSFTCEATSQALYIVPINKAASTPASGQKFWFEFETDNN